MHLKRVKTSGFTEERWGRFFGGAVTVAALLFWAAFAQAIPQWHIPRTARSYAQDPQTAATRFVIHNAHQLGVAGMDLRVDRLFRWRRNQVVRFKLHHAGYPVFRTATKVMVTPNGSIHAAVVDVPQKWRPNAESPAITAREAAERVEDLWLAKPNVTGPLGRPDVELGYWVWGKKGVLCYRVLMAVGYRGYLHYIDAVSGKLLFHHSTVFDARGRYYEQNPIATPDTLDASMLNLDDTQGPGNVLVGWEGMLESYNYINGAVEDWDNIQLEHLAVGDASGNFVYDATTIHPSFQEPFTEVNLYYHLDHTMSYFVDVHEMVFARKLSGIANYGQLNQQNEVVPYENAFFTPVTMGEVVIALGQGATIDYGYDGDVILHEFGHFVVDTIAALGYLESYFDEWGRSQMPGGIHEGLADYWSSTQMDDSVTGEYALGQYARDMNNNKVCPDDMVGEPHIDGEVAGGAVWAVRESVGAETADQLIFGALTLLTPNATFQDLAQGILTTGQDMVANNELTQAALDDLEADLADRGMLGCGRWLEVSGTETPSCMMIGFDMIAQQMGGTCEQMRQYLPYYLPGPFQFKVTAPADVDQLALHFNVSQMAVTPGDDLLYRIYVRRGEMVHYRMEDLFGMMQISVPEDYDFESPDLTASHATVTLSADSTPLLEAGAEYYFAIGYQSCPTTQATFEVTTEEIEPPECDAGVSDSAVPDAGDATLDASITGSGPNDDDDGCNCRAEAGQLPGLPLSILFVLGLGLLLGKLRRRNQ
jgi:MYXO-CTERM domain-containing protein